MNAIELSGRGWLASCGSLLLLAACPSTRFGSDLHNSPAVCGLASYQWLDDESLGTVLEREEVRTSEVDLLASYIGLLKDAERAVVTTQPKHRVFLDRIRYVTQDRGHLVEATAMIAYPDPREVAGTELPLMIYEHGTTGFTDNCAPSRSADNALAIDAAMASAFAGYGYYVVAPDYLNMRSLGEASTELHPYLIGEPTAIASLDAGRAGRLLAAEDGIAVGPTVVVGASQGGHAAAMTVRYQPHYANEMKVVGAIYAVPPLDFAAHAAASMKRPGDPRKIGNIVSSMLAAADWYELPAAALDEAVAPAVSEAVAGVIHQECLWPSLEDDIAEIFTADALDAAQRPAFGGIDPWSCIFTHNSLVETKVQRLEEVPALIVLGENDDLVSAVAERAAFSKLCDQGMQLELMECAGQDHAGGYLASLDQMLVFLEARVRGEPLDNACVPTDPQVCASDPRIDDDVPPAQP